MNELLTWLYQQLVGLLTDLFAAMGGMGVELFRMFWVQAVLTFFHRLAWALYGTGLVVALFECGIEYTNGRANVKGVAINTLKGFLAASLFTTLPVELKTALTIQAGVRKRPMGSMPRSSLAFHINRREEAIDLGDVSGTLPATPNIQMQPFISQPTFAAGFNAGAGTSAGGIGYSAECAPTLKAGQSGNMTPSVLCLNDRGGQIMHCTKETAGTLRAQARGHQPLVFKNHGIDARYTGPLSTAPTLSARAGTGGNNTALIADLYARKRTNNFQESDTASTQGVRQYKDATDLILQKTNAPACFLIRRLTPLECERLQGLC